MSAIEHCRTAALGGHVESCEDCGHWRIAYNSCRNRHCPKCQGAAARTWLAEREADLLPVGYFHVVFTLPHPPLRPARRDRAQGRPRARPRAAGRRATARRRHAGGAARPASAMPLLRRAHGHHRGGRALESAPRTAARADLNRKERSVTRHGLVPPRLAAPALRATRQLAPSPSIAALSDFSAGRPHRKSGWIPDTGRTQPVRIGAGLCQRWSRRPQDQPEIEISIGHRPDPAGSFLGDFRTPAGARNPSRKRKGCFVAGTGPRPMIRHATESAP
jgi:hypothetical protein